MNLFEGGHNNSNIKECSSTQAGRHSRPNTDASFVRGDGGVQCSVEDAHTSARIVKEGKRYGELTGSFASRSKDPSPVGTLLDHSENTAAHLNHDRDVDLPGMCGYGFSQQNC